jgi:type II secretory pathway pseudopilin PulG
MTMRGRLREVSGQGLVEMLIGLVLLAIAVSALLAVLTASALSLQHSAHRGTALSLANQQLELYRRLGYDNIRLSAGSIPTKIGGSCPYNAADDPYTKANCSDSAIPPATGLVVDTGGPTCATPTPPECQATRVVSAAVSPDKYDYRIDTYITFISPTNARQLKQVYVVVRDNRLPGKPILARNASTFDLSNAATG